MVKERDTQPQQVLIASSHPLFGHGLQSLLQKRQHAPIEIVGIASNIGEAIKVLNETSPDLVIVDYDDQELNREEFLTKFIGGEKKLRVMVLSLDNPDQAMLYNRQKLPVSQIERWLYQWSSREDENGEAENSVWQKKKEIPNRNEISQRRSGMKHLILAGILVILVTILLIIGASYARLLPVSASVQAIPIDSMFRKEFVVIAFLFSLIVVFMVYSIIAFRRKPGDMSDAKHIVGNHNLEVTWTVIPLIIVLAFSFLGAQALGDTQSVDPKPLEVNVIASQWVWRFDYPDSSVVSSDLVLPVNQQAVLHLSSKDVIHSFWVPEFRVKQDALPGGENFIRDLRVTPNKIGTYRLMCAELCGLNHSTMEANVIVMLLVDYQAWIATQSGESADPVQRGQKWVQQYGCLSCHTTDGTKKVGPTWKGVYGSTVTLQDGSTVTVDDAYIIESIKNPSAKIVQGFNNLMPASAGSDLKDQQIADIIAFIKSLK